MEGEGPIIPVPLRTRDERRLAERFSAAMPVTVDGQAGTTEDLSSSGLSFISDRSYALGARVEVVIEYLLDGHQYPLRCEAEVMRIDPAPGGFRVGARLLPQSQIPDVSLGDEAAAQRQRLRSVG